jgi:hypothetical protein
MVAVMQTRWRNKVERVANRASREVTARVPYLETRSRRRRDRLRADHAGSLPQPTPSQSELLAPLRHDGAVVTTLANLGIDRTSELQTVLEEMQARLATTLAEGRRVLSIGRDDIARDPVVWTWGLSEELLELAECYLGLPPLYHGAHVRREIADGNITNVRQWHRDTEDDRILKVLVWLNDVDEAGGPFEFVPRSTTETATKQLSYVSGFVNEDRFRRTVDPTSWRAAIGPTWTALLADTAAVFHRAKAPTETDRYSVTFSYTTDAPRKVHPVVPFTADQLATIRAGLSERQLRSLPPLVGPAADI